MTPQPSITAKTWVVVFDGGRAAAFENEGFDDAPNLRCVLSTHDDNPRTSDQGVDRPGRFSTPAGGHAAASDTDLHDAAQEAFVDGLAHEIEAAATDRFERLVLIAPQKLLTRFLSKAPQAASKLAGSRAGDFAHMPVKEIERAFLEALAAS